MIPTFYNGVSVILYGQYPMQHCVFLGAEVEFAMIG